MAKKVIVGGRIESKEVGGIVTGAAEILDDTKGKKQSVINQETDAELERLDGAKQNVLTFDNVPTEGSNNPVKSGGLYTAQQAILLAIAAINELIPSAASVLNQLADKAFVNSSISTNTATFRGTSAAGLNEQQFLEWANGLEHDLNDYVFWQTSDSAGNTLFKRYKWNGTEWAYEYTLNNSTFTAEQWEAIQSGITALLVTKLRALPTAQELIQSFDGKQDVLTFDNVPTLGSNNPVKSSGIYNVIKAITDLVPAEATAQNQLADKADVAAKIVAAIPSWKGQYDALTDLQAVTGAKAGDMGCVKTTDSDGHAVLTFYQYSAQGAWVVYYTLRHYAQNKPATTGATGDYPYNGMGRIELQKNIVNGVNTLTQAMLTQQNTIYVIQYDFTLGGNITVPANCVLEFEGGSITVSGNNNTITGNNTGIDAELVKIFDTDVTLDGAWNISDFYPEWYGAKRDGTTDDYEALQKSLDFVGAVNNTKTLVLSIGTYIISQGLVIPSNRPFNIKGQGYYSIIKAAETSTINAVFSTISGNYTQCRFSDFSVYGHRTGTYVENDGGDNYYRFNTNSTTNVKYAFYFPTKGLIYTYLRNIYIQDCEYGIYSFATWGVLFENVYTLRCDIGLLSNHTNGNTIRNCEFNTCREYGIIAGGNVIIDSDTFEIIGKSAIMVLYNGDASITNNYFEQTSCDANDTFYINSALTTQVTPFYADIIINGASEYGNKNLITSAYPSKAVIENNHSIAFIRESEPLRRSFVFVASCYGLTIKNNRVNPQLYNIDGYSIAQSVYGNADVFNIVIENNINSSTQEIIGNFKVLEKYATNDLPRFKNIHSNLIMNDLSNQNLGNYCGFIQFNGSTFYKIEELNEKYLGRRVFAFAQNEKIEILPKFNSNQLSSNPYLNGVVNGKLLFIRFFVYKTNEWVKEELCYMCPDTTMDITYKITYDCSKITLPEIYVIGNNKDIETPTIPSLLKNSSGSVSAFFKIVVGNDVNIFLSDNIKKLVSVVYETISYDDSEFYSVTDNGQNIGTTDQRPVVKYSGMQYYDTIIKKSIWWDGTQWVDATGTPV